MRTVLTVFFGLVSLACAGQDLSSRSNEIPLDFRKTAEIQSGSVPNITWVTPKEDLTFAKPGNYTIRIALDSKHALKSVFLFVRDKASRELKGTYPLLSTDTKLNIEIEKTIPLPEGVMELEILAQNETGFKSLSRREVHVWKTGK